MHAIEQQLQQPSPRHVFPQALLMRKWPQVHGSRTQSACQKRHIAPGALLKFPASHFSLITLVRNANPTAREAQPCGPMLIQHLDACVAKPRCQNTTQSLKLPALLSIIGLTAFRHDCLSSRLIATSKLKRDLKRPIQLVVQLVIAERAWGFDHVQNMAMTHGCISTRRGKEASEKAISTDSTDFYRRSMEVSVHASNRK